jgi:hypothetical protein
LVVALTTSKRYGEIESIVVKPGIAFVNYIEAGSAREAVIHMNNKLLFGQRLNVRVQHRAGYAIGDLLTGCMGVLWVCLALGLWTRTSK